MIYPYEIVRIRWKNTDYLVTLLELWEEITAYGSNLDNIQILDASGWTELKKIESVDSVSFNRVLHKLGFFRASSDVELFQQNFIPIPQFKQGDIIVNYPLLRQFQPRPEHYFKYSHINPSANYILGYILAGNYKLTNNNILVIEAIENTSKTLYNNLKAMLHEVFPDAKIKFVAEKLKYPSGVAHYYGEFTITMDDITYFLSEKYHFNIFKPTFPQNAINSWKTLEVLNFLAGFLDGFFINTSYDWYSRSIYHPLALQIQALLEQYDCKCVVRESNAKTKITVSRANRIIPFMYNKDLKESLRERKEDNDVEFNNYIVNIKELDGIHTGIALKTASGQCLISNLLVKNTLD